MSGAGVCGAGIVLLVLVQGVELVVAPLGWHTACSGSWGGQV